MEAVNQSNQGIPGQKSILIKHKVVKYRSADPISKEDYLKASMSDEYIKKEAAKQANKEFIESPARKAEKGAFLVGLPAAYSAGSGLIRGFKEPIEKKLSETLRTAKSVGSAMGGAIVGLKSFDALTQKIPVLKQFREDHPVAAATGILTGAVATGVATPPLIDKAAKEIGRIPAGAGETIGNRVKAGLEYATKKVSGETGKQINKKALEPAAHFLTETKLGKVTAIAGLPIAAGGILASMFVSAKNKIKNRQNIEQELVKERNESIKNINGNPFSDKKNGLVKTVETQKIFIVPEEKEAKKANA